MKKIVAVLLVLLIALSVTATMGCKGGELKTSTGITTGGKPTSTNTPVGQTSTATGQTSNPASGSVAGGPRNENWLLGVWEASVPNTDAALFTGKKIVLKISDVMLASSEKVQGRPTGRYSYSGSLIWDTGSAEKTLEFVKTNQLSGDSTITWSYLSPVANQFTENISLRIYGSEWQFELDWGPQISKPNSTIKSLAFYGDIENIDISQREEFDPNHMITFKQTSTTAPPMASSPPATSEATGGPEQSSTTQSSTPVAPPANKGTGDLWSDVPMYPNVEKAEDEGFSISVPGDPSFSQAEWRFYGSTDDYAKVVDFYKNEIPAKGWNKMMWMEADEMSWGSFEKNNESRIVMVYIVNDEGGVGINIHSLAK